MKKALKILLIALLSVVGAAALFVGGVALNGSCFHRFTGADERLSRWMGELPDDRLLCETVIPGSHDAGTAGMTVSHSRPIP